MTNTPIYWPKRRAVRFLMHSALFVLVFSLVLVGILAMAAPSPAEAPPAFPAPRLAAHVHADTVLEAPPSLARIEAAMAADAAAIRAAAPPPAPRVYERHSLVLDAPSYFDGASFSEIPRVRRAFAARFHRLDSEHRIIRAMGGSRADEIYRATWLVLSRLGVSEANWIHDDRLDHAAPESNHAERDLPAIFAVLRRTRRTGETLIGRMRHHAHYVTEERTPSARMDRMRWIQELQLDDTRPAHFPETDSNGLPLNWDRDFAPRWRLMRQFADELLHGDHLGPCADAPVISWGGRCEDAAAACDDDSDRGLIRYSCDTPAGPTANGFWCRPNSRGCVQDPAVDPEVIALGRPAPEIVEVAQPIDSSMIESPQVPAIH